jgi:hypothetical protein
VTVQRLDSQDCGIDAEQEEEGSPGLVVPNQGVFLYDCHNNCIFQECANGP